MSNSSRKVNSSSDGGSNENRRKKQSMNLSIFLRFLAKVVQKGRMLASVILVLRCLKGTKEKIKNTDVDPDIVPSLNRHECEQ